MNETWFFLIAVFLGMCVGAIVIAVIADRNHKTETSRLQQEIHNNSVMYLSAVQTMEQQINDKDRELELKQRVCNSLNDEVQRLRRINEKLKRRKEGVGNED